MDERNPIINDREQLAQDLRTLADRLEDGEYEPAEIEVCQPSRKHDNSGHFKIEFYTEEEWRRISAVYDKQFNGP